MVERQTLNLEVLGSTPSPREYTQARVMELVDMLRLERSASCVQVQVLSLVPEKILQSLATSI